MNADRESSGIDELIQRLREQGVAQGQSAADALLDKARRQADMRLDEAQQEADRILATARDDARRIRTAGEEAVRLASRDAVLRLKAELIEQFSDRVRRLITREMQDQELLRQLILEVARRAAPADDQQATVLLPEDVVGVDQLRREPEELKEGSLSHFIVTVTREMLREGIELGVRQDAGAGIRIRLKDDDMEIDLTDHSVAQLLLRHLVPRFRALLEGAVQ